MAYEPPALDSALAAAVGDDPMLVAELRGAFIESARRQIEALAGAKNAADWRNAAWRLQGLGGSFGALELMAAADVAAKSAVGDRGALGLIDLAMARCEGAPSPDFASRAISA